jgi:hypothetical protein
MTTTYNSMHEKTHYSIQFWTRILSQKNDHGEFLKMTIDLTFYVDY